MSTSIATTVKQKHKDRDMSLKEKDIQIRGGRVAMHNEVSIAIKEPDDYPVDKFLIDRLYGIYLTNETNYSKDGNGKEARYCADLHGNGGRFMVNICDLFEHYQEYDWIDIFKTYPENVSTSKDVKHLLVELQVWVFFLFFFFQS